MWLFSTNQVQVFKYVSGFKRIQKVFFLKRMKAQGYSSMGLELKALDVTIGEARLKILVVSKNPVRKYYVKV